MKTYIIVGSEGAMGQAVQELFSSDRVICLDVKAPDSLNPIDRQISMTFDVNRRQDIDRVAAYLDEHGMTIDGLVYLAGINNRTNFYDVTADDWSRTMDVNTAGFLFCMKGWYDCFSPTASVVCVASQNGVVGHEDRISYGPSKAALIHLVKNMSVDLARDVGKDIQINCVSPTYVLTEQNKSFFDSLEGQKLLRRIPYRRLITVGDVVEVIRFLTSNASRAIRGQNIVVDYGYTIV